MSVRHPPASRSVSKQASTQLKAVSQVIHKRLNNAESALQLALAELHKIELELQERTDCVNALNRDLDQLLSFLSADQEADRVADPSTNPAANPAAHEPSSLTPVNAYDYQRALQRRYWLDYDKQREQYYLDMTRDEQVSLSVKVSDARSVYTALKYKCDLMDARLDASRRASQTRAQVRQDAERMDSDLSSKRSARSPL